MSRAEVITLVGGFVVILIGWAALYRYTLSPKAAERMAEANRKYKPRATEYHPATREDFIRLMAEYAVVTLALQLLSLPAALTVLVLVVVARLVRARRKAGRRGPGSP